MELGGQFGEMSGITLIALSNGLGGAGKNDQKFFDLVGFRFEIFLGAAAPLLEFLIGLLLGRGDEIKGRDVGET